MRHPVLIEGSVAVVTGGASGIGLAAAQRYCQMGLKVCIADLGPDRLAHAKSVLEPLAAKADDSTALGPLDNWQRILDANLWGVIHGSQVFVPGMLARGRPGLVINTGSKQGITTPPGNPAYNVSKAGVKAYTEALQHQLRNTPGSLVQAHLLIPGFVHTGISGSAHKDKPAGAWTAAQTVDFMLERLAAGDFYILCPDNEVNRELDERRILWAAGDIVENRPPLSRWHPKYAEAFKASLKPGPQ
jgi:NAD(P)-dependent dehydrogenase (short-subunit alcohol dehydrogenase family)